MSLLHELIGSTASPTDDVLPGATKQLRIVMFSKVAMCLRYNDREHCESIFNTSVLSGIRHHHYHHKHFNVAEI